MAAPSSFDCTRCGACCCNPLENEREGVREWVAVEAAAPLLSRRDLVRKLVVLDAAGEPHLRLDRQGRCLALRGALGDRVRCSIYAVRPQGCRRVQPGDRDCRQYRAERGLDAVEATPAATRRRRRRRRSRSTRPTGS